MSARVANVRTTDTDRDISGLLNGESRNPVGLLALLIAESGLRERAARIGNWPDVSFGLAQQTVKFYGHEVPGVTLAAAGTAANTTGNWDRCKEWFGDAAHAIASASRVYDRLLTDAEHVAAGADARLLACLWWNAPNLGGTNRWLSANYWLSDDLARLDPKHAANRANYVRALAEAEQYRAQEDHMPFAIAQPSRNDFPPGDAGTAEFQKSLLEFAIAADLAGEADIGVGALKTLNPVRYKDLQPKKA